MELSEILSVTGIFGFGAALLLLSLLFLVQPVWALVDCIDSERERDAKILVSLALVCTWCVGGLIYGIFFAISRNLRRLSVALVVVGFLGSVGVVGACTMGLMSAAERGRAEAERARVEAETAVQHFRPPPIAAEAVAPFSALHTAGDGARRSVAVAEFTLAGPVPGSARDVSAGVKHVAEGSDALFALTDHDFGALSPSTGRLVGIAVEPSLEAHFSWPKGITWDADAGEVVILVSHVYTRFFRYEPRRAAWEMMPAEFRDLSLVGLAWLPGDVALFAVERPSGARQLERIARFNARGAALGSLALEPPIPLAPGGGDGIQLHASSGRLVLVLPPAGESGVAASARIYVVDPATGAVSAPDTHAARR
jgi:hypothetical protein